MKRIPVGSLEPGMYYTAPVYLAENYLLLVPETQLTADLVARLKEWRYQYVHTDGEPVSTPIATQAQGGPQIALGVDQDVKENTQLTHARQFFGRLQEFVEKTFTAFVTRNELPERVVGDTVKEVADLLRSHRRYLLRLPDLKPGQKNYIVDHSARTTIISLAIGITLKIPPFRLIELGTTALLHEIGMIRLPPQIYMSDKKLTERERKAITAHPVLGYKILKQFSFPNNVCLGVLECREHPDGSGYPQALSGERISSFARIIAVAGSFSALTSHRPYRAAVDPHEAILQMIQGKGTRYDETVLRALVVNLSIFPLGSFVQLANGNRGVVVDTNPANPRAPRVRVLAGPNGERYAEQPVVDTTAGAELAIARALPPSAPGLAAGISR